MKPLARALGIMAALLVLGATMPAARAQGMLTPPPGAPAPTQRSLQEVWGKLADLDSSTRTLATEVAGQRLALQQLVALTPGVQLPWQVSTITTVTLDPNLPQRTPAVAVAADGRIFVAYNDGWTLRLLEGDGVTWTTTSFSGAAWSWDLVLDPDDQPALLVLQSSVGLILRRRTTSGWVESGAIASGLYFSNSFGVQPNLVRTPAGEWIAAYSLDVGQMPVLEIARSPDGLAWTKERPEPLNVHEHNLALQPDGRPAIAYTMPGWATVRRWDGAAWSEVFKVSGLFVDLAYQRDGRVGVILQSADAALHYGESDGGAPSLTAIADPGTFLVGQVLIAPDGQPSAVTHAWNGAAITYHRRVGATWQVSLVAPVRVADTGTGFAYGRDLQPIVVFFEGNQLRLARPAPFGAAAGAL